MAKLLPGWEFWIRAASAACCSLRECLVEAELALHLLCADASSEFLLISPLLPSVVMTVTHHHALAAVNFNKVLLWPSPLPPPVCSLLPPNVPASKSILSLCFLPVHLLRQPLLQCRWGQREWDFVRALSLAPC
jgi:hypothetical protein